MNHFKYRILLIFFIQAFFYRAYSQVSENVKVALVHKIANCVVWTADTSTVFTIGVLSENKMLINTFTELSKIAKIHKKNIRIKAFSSEKNIQYVQLLYVDQSFNKDFSAILKRMEKRNSLLISEEHNILGEIMINLKFDAKKNALTFEYNRANILFQGLDLTPEIVLLKGTEIEIRDLYLQAKKLSDEQKMLTESLKNQNELQNKRILIQKDSVQLMKFNVTENKRLLDNQVKIISQKDSVSDQLSSKIIYQQTELEHHNQQIILFTKEKSFYENTILQYKNSISFQKELSDSLTNDIALKMKELEERKKTLNSKEGIIQKQTNWLIFSSILICIILLATILILRIYIKNQKAKHKINEQKNDLLTIIERLKKTQQQLINSEKMASLGVLVAGVAHEINNPVNFINSGITGFERLIDKLYILLAELNKLQPNYTAEDITNLMALRDKLKLNKSLELIPDVIKNIKTGIMRTIEITNGLRLYSRIDKEEKSLNNINQILNASLLLLNSKIKNRIQIIKKYDELPQIYVFPGKLSQVFINILSNAIDAIIEKNDTFEKSILTIHSFVSDEEIIIEFIDTGTGISPEHIDKLYDPFFTTKEIGKGTGLGLSISQGIIAEHNGKIFAVNNEKEGATITIQIPIIK